MEKLITLLFTIVIILTGQTVFAQNMIIGVTGGLVPELDPKDTKEISCIVNGVTITTSGTNNSAYFPPSIPQNANCSPQAAFIGIGNWTSFSSTGTITYTFSEPIVSAIIAYTGVNAEDLGQITTNSSELLQLSNPCGLDILENNVIDCNYAAATLGDVTITVSSGAPFTTITLTNIGGGSGWGTANPCNFKITLPTIHNCQKIYLDELCYHATQNQTTALTVFNNSLNGSANKECTPATIDGVACTENNVTIESITPLPFGCFFNPNGTLTIPAGTLPFHTQNEYLYQFRSIADPTIVSEPFRVDFGVADKVVPAYVIISLHTGSAPFEVYSNGSANILTTPLVSQINTTTTGNCSYIPALIDLPNISNTVTVTETTSPINSYYKINTISGAIEFRPPYSSSNPPPVPSNSHYELTYEMCINNTGTTTFCASQRVLIYYYYGTNKMVHPANSLETLIVTPNPSPDGKYMLLFDTSLITATIEVYNMLGQQLHNEQVNDVKEHELFLDTLPQGTYIIKVSSGNERISKTIVKQ